MFDKEAIQALQEGESITAASTAVQAALGATASVAALPNDFQLHSLESYQPTRRRARATVSTRFIAPFAVYAKAYATAGAAVFIDPANLSATAVLDLGTVEEPGHADHKAVLEPARTAAYAALLAASSKPLTQQELAEFFEDWTGQVQFFNEAGDISPKQAVAAVRRITIEALQKVESEEQSLSANRSAFESVSATSKEPLPTTIYFKTQPYADLAERTFVLRLSVLTGEKTPRLRLRIQKAELHDEEIATDFGAKLTATLGETLPVLIGKYAKAS